MDSVSCSTMGYNVLIMGLKMSFIYKIYVIFLLLFKSLVS